MIERLDYIEINPKAINGLGALNKHVATIDAHLRALVELRLSQLNGCVYCVDLHAQQARSHGETQQRIDCLSAWSECPFFDEMEKAAFSWAEAVTFLGDTSAPGHLFKDLSLHFSEEQIVDLTLIISLMNAWNRIAVSFRHLPEKRLKEG